MSDYKRLTKKDKYGHWYTDTKINDRFMWSTDGKVWGRDLTHCAFDGEAIDRLAELEEKLKAGGWWSCHVKWAIRYMNFSKIIDHRLFKKQPLKKLLLRKKDCA